MNFSYTKLLVNRLQIYHSNYLVLHILNNFYPDSAYIFSFHFKIYIGKQSFTKTICFASFLFIMNVHIYLLDTVRSNGYTIYSTQ